MFQIINWTKLDGGGIYLHFLLFKKTPYYKTDLYWREGFYKIPEDYDFDAHKKLVPMQPGDVPVTYADTTALEEDFGFKPHTPLREGLRKFAEWYKEFYMRED